MAKKADEISNYIEGYGVSKAAANVYLSLFESGPVGIMELCRNLDLGRNVVYRLLDELEQKTLVSTIKKSFGSIYSARGTEAFEAIIATKEAEVATLKSTLPEIAHQLQQVSSNNTQSIIHYGGVDGLKQVNWNLTKASGEYRVFEQMHLHEYLDKSFSKNMRRRYVEKGLVSYDLTNRSRVNNYFDDVDSDYWQTKAHYRHIEKQVLTIEHEMFIYDDTVTLLDYDKNKPEAIEIRNKRLALMQKQFFDALWAQAKEFVFDPATNDRILP